MTLDNASFDPTVYMSLEEATAILYPVSHDDEAIQDMGNLKLSNEFDTIIPFMDTWVERVDIALENVAEGSPLYLRLLAERGCTFDEYKDLFNTAIQEHQYHQFPAFTFFSQQTIDSLTLWNFISGKEAHEESYLKDMVNTPITALSFFFDKLQAIIPYKNLKRHAYVSGKSGSGKSELLKLIFYGIQKRSQAKHTATLVMIDPHGDLSREIKNFHCNNKHRDRLIYIDPYLKEGYTPVINPLHITSKDERTIDVMSQQLEKVFKELVADSAVTRPMQTLLIPCLSTLLRKGDATLEDLQRFMNDKYNADLVALGKKSPIKTHRTFFERDFHDSLFHKSKTSIRTKIQSLLNYQVFANLFCGTSTIDLEKELNNGKVILFNLSKGRLGDETAKAFGTFIVGCINAIVKKRESMPKDARKPTFVFIDECHNYMIESTKEILAENRKYALHLILANQYIHQVSDDFQRAFKSNTDVKIAGRNDEEHFRSIASGLRVSKEQLLKLPELHFYIRTGDRTPIQFKPANILVKNPSYYLSQKESEALDNYLLYESGYYTPLLDDDYDTEEKGISDDTPDDHNFRFNEL